MSNQIYKKVLIIGAGPAGAACGIKLTQLGIDCLIVDKMKFPRTKLCAGYFSAKAVNALSSILDENEFMKCIGETSCSKEGTFRIFNGPNNLIFECERDPCIMIDRPKFDYWMVKYYEELGGLFFENSCFLDIDFEHKIAIFPTYQVKYDYLIAADGANSTVEFLLNRCNPSFRRKSQGHLGVEINVKIEDFAINGINMYYNIVPSTYAWAFAKGNTSCIGFIKRNGATFDARDVMKKFSHDLGIRNILQYQVKGAMLNFDYSKKHYFSDVLFVGDAAGLADPFTGEGISYAIISGIYAAEAIADACHEIIENVFEDKIKNITSSLMKGEERQHFLFESNKSITSYFKYFNLFPELVKDFMGSL